MLMCRFPCLLAAYCCSEQAWREKKEADMKGQARYREELLQLKKSKVETASVGEKMRAPDKLR